MVKVSQFKKRRFTGTTSTTITRLKAQVKMLERVRKEEEQKERLQRQIKSLKESPTRRRARAELKSLGKSAAKQVKAVHRSLLNLGRGMIS